MNRISFLNRGYAFKGLLAVLMRELTFTVFGQNSCYSKHSKLKMLLLVQLLL